MKLIVIILISIFVIVAVITTSLIIGVVNTNNVQGVWMVDSCGETNNEKASNSGLIKPFYCSKTICDNTKKPSDVVCPEYKWVEGAPY